MRNARSHPGISPPNSHDEGDKRMENSQNVPNLFGVSIQGLSHIAKNLPCQDYCRYSVLSHDTAIITVADGVGSEKNSLLGSDIATKASMEFLIDEITKKKDPLQKPMELLGNSMVYAREKIHEWAEKDTQAFSSYACTLIIVVWHKGRLYTSHIGDGGVIAVKENEYLTISAPDILEYSNLVYPLTYDDWKPHVKFSDNDGWFKYCAVLTDGCQKFAFIRKNNVFTPFPGFLGPLFEFSDSAQKESAGVSLLKQLLNEDRFKQYTHDDKTLVIGGFPRE